MFPPAESASTSAPNPDTANANVASPKIAPATNGTANSAMNPAPALVAAACIPDCAGVFHSLTTCDSSAYTPNDQIVSQTLINPAMHFFSPGATATISSITPILMSNPGRKDALFVTK